MHRFSKNHRWTDASVWKKFVEISKRTRAHRSFYVHQHMLTQTVGARRFESPSSHPRSFVNKGGEKNVAGGGGGGGLCRETPCDARVRLVRVVVIIKHIFLERDFRNYKRDLIIRVRTAPAAVVVAAVAVGVTRFLIPRA